jgi:hypothetical protein
MVKTIVLFVLKNNNNSVLMAQIKIDLKNLVLWYKKVKQFGALDLQFLALWIGCRSTKS